LYWPKIYNYISIKLKNRKIIKTSQTLDTLIKSSPAPAWWSPEKGAQDERTLLAAHRSHIQAAQCEALEEEAVENANSVKSYHIPS